jgi:hypothetical protein
MASSSHPNLTVDTALELTEPPAPSTLVRSTLRALHALVVGAASPLAPWARCALRADDARGGGGRPGFPPAGLNLGAYPLAQLAAEWLDVGLPGDDALRAGVVGVALRPPDGSEWARGAADGGAQGAARGTGGDDAAGAADVDEGGGGDDNDNDDDVDIIDGAAVATDDCADDGRDFVHVDGADAMNGCVDDAGWVWRRGTHAGAHPTSESIHFGSGSSGDDDSDGGGEGGGEDAADDDHDSVVVYEEEAAAVYAARSALGQAPQPPAPRAEVPRATSTTSPASPVAALNGIFTADDSPRAVVQTSGASTPSRVRARTSRFPAAYVRALASARTGESPRETGARGGSGGVRTRGLSRSPKALGGAAAAPPTLEVVGVALSARAGAGSSPVAWR